MARPHIEFIQSQVLPWHRGLPGSPYGDVEAKCLSRDTKSGAATFLTRYPAGWSRAASYYLSATEELFVLDGELEINGAVYGTHCYANLPRGYSRRTSSSKTGAIVITYFDGAAGQVEGEAATQYDTRKLIEFIQVPPIRDLGAEDFGRLGSSDFNPEGLGAQILREDPDSGEVTWIMGCDGGWMETSLDGGYHMERHPTVEEIYVVAGEMAGNTGVLYPGAYFWRPPNIWHGPYGVRGGGFIHLNRCHGGPFATDFKSEPKKIDLSSDYRPILPPELSHFRATTPHLYAANY